MMYKNFVTELIPSVKYLDFTVVHIFIFTLTQICTFYSYILFY